MSLLLSKPITSPIGPPGLVASSKPLTNRSVSLFRNPAAIGFSSRCFTSIKRNWREADCEYAYNLKIPDRRSSRALNDIETRYTIYDSYYDVLCHRLPATRNLARILNLLDRKADKPFKFGIVPCGHPRWDVIQVATVLYLLYNMSGIPTKDAKELFDKDFQGSTNDFFRRVRVSNFDGMSEIIVEEVDFEGMSEIIVEEACGPRFSYNHVYSISLCLPDCIVSDAKVDLENEVMKITIPKKCGKWIHRITAKPRYR